ncbi:hypothetical protein O6H91_20G072400 [Diphasiastrum complanatum]|uniref:Uncharacterized protein n=1 Tax=Diphasiastrum complanatum TaxID=34168 RepID=A0ACC2ARJ1_DIPCM|nr:hypothetical protein O6H91_20G072400 [Diphasiastrum complanatum]
MTSVVKGKASGDSASLETTRARHKNVMEDHIEVNMPEPPSESCWDDKQCSMCGDVGFYGELFKCTRCLYRFQHTYCSCAYPNMDLDEAICDWCSKSDRDSGMKQADINTKRKPRSFKAQLGRDALALLLEVAHVQSAVTENVSEAGEVDQQAFFKKDSLATHGKPVPKRQRNGHNEKKKPGPGSWRQMNKSKLPLGLPSKGVGRRYKLLADVLL